MQNQKNNENLPTAPEVAEHVEAVAVTPNAVELMERAVIDTQIATAKKYPRSLTQFLKRATDMVSIDKETAASCLYSRPVGKEGNRMRYAQGESIRLAEIVAATYGNLRVAALITEITPRYVKAIGMAHDLENNYAIKTEGVESTVNRHGIPYSERMRLVTAKAVQSKVIRDAIFRVVPKSLCKPIANIAKEIALGKGLTLQERRIKFMEWVEGLGIDKERVFQALGVDGVEEITMDHLIILTGVHTAIKDHDITVNEAFPPIVSDESEAKTGVAGLKDRLSKNKDKPEPEKETTDPDFEAKKQEQIKEMKAKEEKPKKRGRPKKETETEPPAGQAENSEQQAEEFKRNVIDKEPEPLSEEPKYKCLRCSKEFSVKPSKGKCTNCLGEVAATVSE